MYIIKYIYIFLGFLKRTIDPGQSVLKLREPGSPRQLKLKQRPLTRPRWFPPSRGACEGNW